MSGGSAQTPVVEAAVTSPYLSLYEMHELALRGFWKVTLDTAARVITRRTEPHVNLH
jgi:hypothetical protein